MNHKKHKFYIPVPQLFKTNKQTKPHTIIAMKILKHRSFDGVHPIRN